VKSGKEGSEEQFPKSTMCSKERFTSARVSSAEGNEKKESGTRTIYRSTEKDFRERGGEEKGCCSSFREEGDQVRHWEAIKKRTTF